MKINKEDVRHVAGLARLKIGENELESFAGQLASILDYVDSLKEIDTSGVSPTAHAVLTKNAFRSDEEIPSAGRAAALANALETEDGFFVVPKIIE